MRTPTQDKTQGRQQVSSFVSYESSIGGWNAIDPLSNMKPTEAIALDNWFPKTGYCETRGGSASYATGMTGTGKTLVVWRGLTGTNKMFCSTQSGIYNVSSAGAVGASALSRTNGKHQWVMYGDGTSQWLIMVNGVDKPAYYDGTTWTAVDGATSPALTGVTTTNLIGLTVHQGRLSFIEKDSLSWWYLPSGVAGGALTKFDLSGIVQKGGFLMATDSWTVDAGNGPEDRMVFITSEGELVIYVGNNPSVAANWQLVGVYNIGKPLGRKCTLKIGSDLAILTQNGIFPLSQVLLDSGLNFADALSRKIESVFNDSARVYGSNFGWTAVRFPVQSAVLVNIPIAEDGVHYQYVVNTITKAWCRFIGWDAEDFVEFNNELYFCQGTKVVKAWTGTDDQGANIDYYAKTAFSYFGKRGQLKSFKMFRPLFNANGPINFLADMDIDYSENILSGTATLSVVSSALWGVFLWGIGLWGTNTNMTKLWITPSTYEGFSGATKLKITSNSAIVKWLSIDYVFEDGSIL